MNSILVGGLLLLQMMSLTLFDFSDIEHVEAWTIIDDGVMGGVSQGNWYQEDDYAVFEGDISLENNGGFSSVRVGFPNVDFSDFDGIELTVRGDGQTYAFGLRNRDSRLDHRLAFETTIPADDDWQTVRIPFDDLVATWFGVAIPDARLDRSQVRGMTLIISDKQEGAFRLEVARIALYVEDAAQDA